MPEERDRRPGPADAQPDPAAGGESPEQVSGGGSQERAPSGTRRERAAGGEPPEQPAAGRDAGAGPATSKAPGSRDSNSAASRAARRPDREPVLPSRAAEDQDVGWGELPRDEDDWYERERPPHHGT